MKEEEFKQMCDQIRMSEENKRRIWAAAKAKAEKHGRNRSRKRHYVGAVLTAAVSAAAILLAVFWIPGIVNREKAGQPAALLGQKQTEETETLKTEPGKQTETIAHYLLLGLDSRTGENLEDSCADAILLASLDEDAGHVWLTAIPSRLVLGTQEACRYSWEDDTENGLKAAVESCFGITISGQAEVSFSSFARIINQAGGLELEVTQEDLNRTTAPLNGYLTEIVGVTGIGTAGQIEHTGVQLLDGPQTLAWCRVNAGGGYGRGQRYLMVMKKLAEKMNSFENIVSVCRMMASEVKTDLPVTDIALLAVKALECHKMNFIDLTQSAYIEEVPVTTQQNSQYSSNGYPTDVPAGYSCIHENNWCVTDPEGLIEEFYGILHGSVVE